MTPERLAEICDAERLTPNMVDELIAAAKEGIEAREDAERLDWMDSAESSLVGGSTPDGVIRWGFTTPDPGDEWTIRKAIDLARKAK